MSGELFRGCISQLDVSCRITGSQQLAVVRELVDCRIGTGDRPAAVHLATLAGEFRVRRIIAGRVRNRRHDELISVHVGGALGLREKAAPQRRNLELDLQRQPCIHTVHLKIELFAGTQRKSCGSA